VIGCPHSYLIDPTETVLRDKFISKYCLACWDAHADLLLSLRCERPEKDEPCKYGFCDILMKAVRKRGFTRDADASESKMLDLRLQLIEHEQAIMRRIAGKSAKEISAVVWKVCKNKLQNDQTRGEGRIIQNSTISLSLDGTRTDSKYLARLDAANNLTEMTGGDSASANDDRSLDERSEAFKPAKDKGSEARVLFDSLMAQASSQIATLTGGRQDGFDTYLDLNRALTKLPEDQQSVFTALWMDNEKLMNRSRSYPEVESLTGLSLQNVRTLERRAIDNLKPMLGPSFFRRRR